MSPDLYSPDVIASHPPCPGAPDPGFAPGDRFFCHPGANKPSGAPGNQDCRLSAEGLKASEIAARVFLSVHTINTHRQRIYAKMDVKNVSDMLRKTDELSII